MRFQLRGGFTTDDPKLGRLPSQNPRRLELFPATNLELPQALKVKRWRRTVLLDQSPRPGYDGSGCVGMSGTNFLRSGPIYTKRVGLDFDIREPYAIALYHDCQKNDEWAGEDYGGTSVDALGKMLLRRGLISSYHWITGGTAELSRALQLQPVIMGTEWWSGMDAANDGLGVAYPTGTIRGGHAWLCDGYLPSTVINGHRDDWFRGFNSWGPWGELNLLTGKKSGTFWLNRSSMEKLLQSGEAMMPAEVKAFT